MTAEPLARTVIVPSPFFVRPTFESTSSPFSTMRLRPLPTETTASALDFDDETLAVARRPIFVSLDTDEPSAALIAASSSVAPE